MAWADRIAKLKALRDKLTGEQQAEMDVEIADLEKEAAEAAKAPVTNPTPTGGGASGQPDIAAIVKAAVDEAMKTVQPKLDTLGAALKSEQDARVATTKALQDEQEAKRTKEIDDYVAKLVAEGKIPNEETKITQMKTDCAASFDTVKRIYDEMAPNPALAKKNGTGTGTTQTPPAAGQDGKKYDSRFAASLPKEFMAHVEQDVAAN